MGQEFILWATLCAAVVPSHLYNREMSVPAQKKADVITCVKRIEKCWLGSKTKIQGKTSLECFEKTE